MRFKLLPHWCITNILPAFYDYESLTAIEQTGRLYKTIEELLKDYNKYVDEVNSTINEFMTTSGKHITDFETKIIKITHDYIATIDMKMAHQDRVIADAVKMMKEGLTDSIKSVLADMKESGELTDELMEGLDHITSRIVALENKFIPTKTSELENDANFASRSYVDEEIATFDFIKVVDVLPEKGLENRVYFVPKADTQTQDLFDEYAWINDKWEWITTKQIEVDLTPYYKKTEVDVLNESLETRINNKIINVEEETKRSYMLATFNNDDITYQGEQIVDPITLDSIVYKKGEKFTLENNKIKIGAGVSVIRVSGAIFLNDFTGTGYAWGKIMKNGGVFATSMLPRIEGAAPYGSVCIPSMLITVQEGDLINLRIEQSANENTVIRGYASSTFLFVEEYY